MVKNNNTLVSIIIVNWNGEKWLNTCFETIYAQTYHDFEILLVDNNSGDNSVEYTKKEWPLVKVIELDQNYAYAGGNNRGALHAKGELLLFLNNDTKLFPDCLERLVDKHKSGSITIPLQLVGEFSSNLHTEFMGNGVDIFGYPYGISDREQQKVFYADGAALFLEKSLFFELGQFDEKLFMFQEDIDLSWKARITGIEITTCPNAKLYHFSGGTAPGGNSTGKDKYSLSEFRRFHNEKNIIRNILKNYSLMLAIPILGTLMFIHAIEIIGLTLFGGYKLALCYLRAYWWNISNLQDTMAMRRFIQTKRVLSDFDIIGNMYFRYSKLTAILRLGKPNLA